ncbi:hypothetical protein KIW84_054887 [Lathyrus oleraceus]|uniref:Uncharacterized protein n=1 Tax=Pisum sativum TaxID=3888 RepID=A0A9D4WWL9_PEA|nr:hypothetical protein KIW84_054887 [Pisum sativum]
MPPKYGKLGSFPSHRFGFHEALGYQGVIELISDSGSIFPYLVKEFYANFSIDIDFVLISKVKNTEIALSLEDLGKCLNVPCVGKKNQHNFTPEWPDYNEFNYYVEILRMTRDEIMSRQNPSSSRGDLKRELKEKMKTKCEINIRGALKKTRIYQDINGTYKYKDYLTAPIPPPAPKGRYTNEAIYNRIFSVEYIMMTEFRDLHLEFNAYKNRQPVIENMEEEDMDESD